MKKAISLMLVAAILLLTSIVYADIDNQEILKEDVWEYRILEDGTAEITKCLSKDQTVIIPEQIGGFSVSSLGENSLISCSYTLNRFPEAGIHV